MPNTFPITAMTRLEIAFLLGISRDSLRRKLKENGIILPKGLVTPQWQKKIFDALWYPESHPREAYIAYG